MHVHQVLHQQCNQSPISTHNAMSMVESTDEINVDLTLDKVILINPQLIYMDFIYIKCIIKIILRTGALSEVQLTTATTTINFRKSISANSTIGIKPS